MLFPVLLPGYQDQKLMDKQHNKDNMAYLAIIITSVLQDHEGSSTSARTLMWTPVHEKWER